MYEVAEPGNPALLRYGNKTLLMMGSQSGVVEPASSTAPLASGSGADGVAITFNDHVGVAVNTRRLSDGQIIHEINQRVQQGVSAAVSTVAAQARVALWPDVQRIAGGLGSAAPRAASKGARLMVPPQKTPISCLAGSSTSTTTFRSVDTAGDLTCPETGSNRHPAPKAGAFRPFLPGEKVLSPLADTGHCRMSTQCGIYCPFPAPKPERRGRSSPRYEPFLLRP